MADGEAARSDSGDRAETLIRNEPNLLTSGTALLRSQKKSRRAIPFASFAATHHFGRCWRKSGHWSAWPLHQSVATTHSGSQAYGFGTLQNGRLTRFHEPRTNDRLDHRRNRLATVEISIVCSFIVQVAGCQ